MSDKPPAKAEVQSWIKDGILKLGDPPKSVRTKASYWRKGAMRYLYFTENSVLLDDWYYCEQCKWIIHVVKCGGTTAIKRHWAKHEEVTFELTKCELASLLAQASKHPNVSQAIYEQNMFTEFNDRNLAEFWRKISHQV